MSNKLLLALAVTALVLLMFFCIQVHTPIIEAQLALPSATVEEPRATSVAASVAAPMVAAGTAVLTTAARNGKVTLAGVLPDAAVRDEVVNEARKMFGDNNVIDNTVIQANVGNVAWRQSLPDLLAQTKALPGGEIRIENGVVTIAAEVPANAVKAIRIKSITAAVGPNVKIIDRITVALSGDLQSAVNKALANRAIEFETARAVLTPRGQAILNDVAAVISKTPQGRIDIAGHTDSAGDADINQRLSQSRADAVRAYLIARGVGAARLTSTGYGDARPIADNATSAGQQKNRRIEFSVIQ